MSEGENLAYILRKPAMCGRGRGQGCGVPTTWSASELAWQMVLGDGRRELWQGENHTQHVHGWQLCEVCARGFSWT